MSAKILLQGDSCAFSKTGHRRSYRCASTIIIGAIPPQPSRPLSRLRATTRPGGSHSVESAARQVRRALVELIFSQLISSCPCGSYEPLCSIRKGRRERGSFLGSRRGCFGQFEGCSPVKIRVIEIITGEGAHHGASRRMSRLSAIGHKYRCHDNSTKVSRKARTAGLDRRLAGHSAVMLCRSTA